MTHWKKFEIFLKKSIPEYIIKILAQTGYDNTVSISEICEEDVKTIEEFVDAKLKHIVEASGVYKIYEKFAFLPGHKKLILSLPNQLKLFENIKKRKVEEATEEVELLNQEEIDSLTAKLLSKLSKTAGNIGLNSFTENEVKSTIDVYINHSRSLNEKPSYKCSIKCSECDKIIPCTWNGYWQTGNLDKHLKIHIKKDESPNQQSSSTSSDNTNIRTTATPIQLHIQKVNVSNDNSNIGNNCNHLKENFNSDDNQNDLDNVLGILKS